MPSKQAEKISVSLGSDALARARLIAKRNGTSLSHLIGEALRLLVEEEERRAAALEIIASFPRSARATSAEREALRKQWSTPHEGTAKKSRAVG